MTGRTIVAYWLLLQGTYLAIGIVNFWMLLRVTRDVKILRERPKSEAA